MRTTNHTVDPDGAPEARPPIVPKQRLTKLVAGLAAALAALTGSVVIAEPAQAYSGNAYIAYGLGGINNDQDYFVGTVNVGGALVFCIDPGMGSPFGGSYTEGSATDFGWGPNKTARVNYVASTYHNTTDDNLAAAAQYAIWQLISPWGWNMNGYSGSNFRDAVYHSLQQKGYLSGLGGFATWRLNWVADTAVQIYNDAMTITAGTDTTNYVTGNPTTSTGDLDIEATIEQVDHTDHFVVTIGAGIESGGSTGTLALTNATWDATGTASLTGTIRSGDTYAVTADHAGPTPITVSGTTDTEIVTTSTTTSTTSAQMWIPIVTVLYNSDGARQNLSYGAGTATYQVTVITSTTNTETRSYHFDAAIDSTIWFAPKVTTEVESAFVREGDRLVDHVTPVLFDGSAPWGKTANGGAWLPVTFRATIFKTAGPVADGQPIPDGAVIVGHASMMTNVAADPTGVPVEVGGPTVSESGFYVWVWRAELGPQATGTRPYLSPGVYPWTDDARVPETSVAPFQPFAISTVTGRLVVPGDQISDQLTVSSANGVWLEGQGGEPIPVTFTGTAYQVAGVLPPAQGAGVPSSATVLGTVQVTATGPGVYTSPTVAAPNAGFVTWKWEARVTQQPAVYRPYLAGDWIDDFGIHAESTSVRHPVTITSEVREYNVHLDGRAFDRIVVTGFPADHATFEGDGYWGADTDSIVHTVYGPLEESQLVDDLDLTTAPVLTTISTTARNGVYQVGYTAVDEIRPAAAGYYVVVSSFAGDDRVQPFTSSPADILERFFVPGPPPPPAPTPDVRVSSQATETVEVGQPFTDTALVRGSWIPVGATLVFRAFGPFENAPAEGEAGDPFYESDPIAVTGEGDYTSPEISVETAGSVYWVETVYAADGTVLAAGYLGAPGELTVVTPPSTPEPTPTPTPTETPTPGPTPTPTDTPTPEPTPTPTDTPTPPPPTVPPTEPPHLAYTGMPDWLLPVGLGGATFLLVLGGMLLFGRRLAMARAARGEVRDEDWLSVEQIGELLDRPMEEGDIEAIKPPGDQE